MYDFQGAGEYTLVRSATGDVNVQVRVSPIAHSKTVALNAAVAMNVVSTHVEFDPGVPPVVRVNGKSIARPKSAGQPLPGGGRIAYKAHRQAGDLIVTWPDGSLIDVYANDYAEDVTFTPPAAGVDTFSGLLAAAPTGTTKSIKARSLTLVGGNGLTYVVNLTTRNGLTTLYGPFADSWRVTPKTSLFTYHKGQSTSSFDVKGFPARFSMLFQLPGTVRKKAAGVCTAAGVTDPTLLDDCEFDVGATGKTDFAAGAAHVQANSGTTVTSPADKGNVSAHGVRYYFTHPCAVLTEDEIRQDVGPVASGSISSSDSCLIFTADGAQ